MTRWYAVTGSPDEPVDWGKPEGRKPRHERELHERQSLDGSKPEKMANLVISFSRDAIWPRLFGELGGIAGPRPAHGKAPSRSHQWTSTHEANVRANPEANCI